MSNQNAVASTSTINNVPVQAQFNANGQCLGLVGPAGAFFSPPINGVVVDPITLSIGGVPVTTSTQLPTITSGFGTNPTVTAVNTMGFKIVVGTGGSTGGVIGLPTAVNGWVCYASNVTAGNDVYIQQTGSSTTSVTLAAFGNTTGTSATMTAGTVILVICIAY